jgi:arylsulfatase A-like enzyme
MIMSGPGIPKGSSYNGFNYLSDIAPTLYDYLGIGKPASVEGRSHFSVFKQPRQLVRNTIYNVYGHWSRSFKSADGFKLILYNVDGVKHTQLFNLSKDPWEMQDLSAQPEYRQKVAELTSLLRKEMAETHDNLDIALPNWGRQSTQKPRGS